MSDKKIEFVIPGEQYLTSDIYDFPVLLELNSKTENRGTGATTVLEDIKISHEENFSSPYKQQLPDPRRWKFYYDDHDTTGSTGTFLVSDNKLNFNTTNATSFPVCASMYTLSDSFDVEVDFHILNSPTDTTRGLIVELSTDQLNYVSGTYILIGKFNPTLQNFLSASSTVTDTYSGSDTKEGKLKITVDGIAYTTYYKPNLTDTYWTKLLTGAFTRSTCTAYPEYDPYYDNVTLLLCTNGAHNGTTFIDSSKYANVMTAYNNVVTSRSQYLYNNSSAYFDGTGDTIYTPHATHLDPGTGDWTIEVMVYVLGYRTEAAFILGTYTYGSVDGGTGNTGWIFGIMPTTGALLFAYSKADNSSQHVINHGTVPLNRWVHLAVVKSGNEVYGYIGGVKVGSAILTYNFSTVRPYFRIGSYARGDAASYGADISFYGYMDCIRMTKGVARYTGDYFTPPTKSFVYYKNNINFYLKLSNRVWSTNNTVIGYFDNLKVTGDNIKWPNGIKLDWNKIRLLDESGNYLFAEERYLSDSLKDQVITYDVIKRVSDKNSSDMTCSLWKPEYITKSLWLESSSIDNVEVYEGLRIPKWYDFSGNQYNACQTVVANTPILSLAALNGLNGISFTDTDYVSLPSTALSIAKNIGSLTIFAVAGCSGGDSYRTVININNNAANVTRAGIFFRNTGVLEVGGRRLDADSFQSVTQSIDGNPHICMGEFNYSSALLNAGIDGTIYPKSGAFQTAGNTSNTTSSGIYIGDVGSAGTDSFTGKIYEILVIPSILSTKTRQKIEGYLAWKWGLQANLPSTHPYKNNPCYYFINKDAYDVDTGDVTDTVWLQWDFNTPVLLNKIKVYYNSDVSSNRLNNVSFYGSNSGDFKDDQVLLNTVSLSNSVTDGATDWLNVPTGGMYRYIRMYINSMHINNVNVSDIVVDDIEFMVDKDISASLYINIPTVYCDKQTKFYLDYSNNVQSVPDHNIRFLLYSDEPHNSTNFKDYSFNNALASYSALVIHSTAVTPVIGRSSLYFNSNTLIFPFNLDYIAKDNHIVYELWAKRTRSAVRECLLTVINSGNTFYSIWIEFSASNYVQVMMQDSVPNNILITSTNTITDTEWHHIAVQITSGTVSLYVDGVLSATPYNIAGVTLYTSTSLQLYVGSGASFAIPFIGYMQQAAITKGIKYTGNFTPSKKPLYIPEYVYTTNSISENKVWNSKYVGVFHLNQNPASTIYDSTSNKYTATSSGSMTSSNVIEYTPVGTGMYFDGYDDKLNISSLGGSAYTVGTVEIVAKKATDNATRYDSLYGRSSALSDYALSIYAIDNKISAFSGGVSTSVCDIYADFNDPLHLALKVDTGTVELLNLSTLDKVVNKQTGANLANTNVRIGAKEDTSLYTWQGSISEVRVSNIARSDEWLYLSYLSDIGKLVQTSVNVEYTQNVNTNTLMLIIPSGIVKEDLVNFPATFVLSSDTGVNGVDVTNIFTVLGNNYDRLYIRSSTGSLCYVEVETWDHVNNFGVIHIKVPVVYALKDTHLTVDYSSVVSNSTYVGLTGTNAAKNVWDTNYLAVYHLNNDPSTGGACILDSTSNELHGTPNGGILSTAVTTSAFGKMLTLDGVNDYIALPNISVTDKWTLELLHNIYNSNPGDSLLTIGETGIANATNQISGVLDNRVVRKVKNIKYNEVHHTVYTVDAS